MGGLFYRLTDDSVISEDGCVWLDLLASSRLYFLHTEKTRLSSKSIYSMGRQEHFGIPNC